jgi:hypothetical protein
VEADTLAPDPRDADARIPGGPAFVAPPVLGGDPDGTPRDDRP